MGELDASVIVESPAGDTQNHIAFFQYPVGRGIICNLGYQNLTRIGRMALAAIDPAPCTGRPQGPIVKLVRLSTLGEIGHGGLSFPGREAEGC